MSRFNKAPEFARHPLQRPRSEPQRLADYFAERGIDLSLHFVRQQTELASGCYDVELGRAEAAQRGIE